MEDVQHRILLILLVTLPYENVKSEGKREKIQMTKGTIQSAKREKQKSNGNLDWQGRGNMRGVNCRIDVYSKCNL